MCQVSVVPPGVLEAVIVVKLAVAVGHTFAIVLAESVGAVVPAVQHAITVAVTLVVAEPLPPVPE